MPQFALVRHEISDAYRGFDLEVRRYRPPDMSCRIGTIACRCVSVPHEVVANPTEPHSRPPRRGRDAASQEHTVEYAGDLDTALRGIVVVPEAVDECIRDGIAQLVGMSWQYEFGALRTYVHA